MWRSVSAFSARQFMNKIGLLSTLSRKHLCQADVNQTHKDEVNSSKLGGGILLPSQSGMGCQVGCRHWRGSERASRCLYVQLTPASLNHWTSQERLPPLLSDHSSASFSLQTGSGGRNHHKLW